MLCLEIKNLSVQLQDVHALRNVSFTLETGGVNVILGRSGTGKTTLLRAINRLNEHEAKCKTTGEVYLFFDGQRVPIYDAKSYGKKALLFNHNILRQKVGMVFQTPHILPMSIEQNILFPLQFHKKLTKDELQYRLKEVLQWVELWDDVCKRLHKPASQLSGGQQQRLCLARTIALKPDYLLLDEPTASLDVATTECIESVIAKIAKSTHCLMVCHSVKQAMRLGERFILLDNQGNITVREKESLSEADLYQFFQD